MGRQGKIISVGEGVIVIEIEGAELYLCSIIINKGQEEIEITKEVVMNIENYFKDIAYTVCLEGFNIDEVYLKKEVMH